MSSAAGEVFDEFDGDALRMGGEIATLRAACTFKDGTNRVLQERLVGETHLRAQRDDLLIALEKMVRLFVDDMPQSVNTRETERLEAGEIARALCEDTRAALAKVPT